MSREEAAGFIETHGYLPAVEAADVCLKTAHVRLAGMINAGGGLITIIVRGDVGAVKAAIETATLAADRIGQVVSTHVIARPVQELDAILSCLDSSSESKETTAVVQAEPMSETESSIPDVPTVEQLQAHSTAELRNMARKLSGFTISRPKIKYARKGELIQTMIEYYEGMK